MANAKLLASFGLLGLFLVSSATYGEIVDTGWVQFEDDFQDRYDQLTADGYYPTTISGRLALFDQYRGVFTKVPSEGFTAYGFHGLGQARYEELLAWADAEGFLITSDQSFTDFWGEPRHQIVMVYSGKFVPIYKDGKVQMPLVWYWNGAEWQSYFAELTLMDGFSLLTFYLSAALQR